jgi:hypothetical protein
MRNWTPDEDGQLLEMLRLKFHRAIMARVFDCTEAAIDARAAVLTTLRKSDEAWHGLRILDRVSLVEHRP